MVCGALGPAGIFAPSLVEEELDGEPEHARAQLTGENPALATEMNRASAIPNHAQVKDFPINYVTAVTPI